MKVLFTFKFLKKTSIGFAAAMIFLGFSLHITGCQDTYFASSRESFSCSGTGARARHCPSEQSFNSKDSQHFSTGRSSRRRSSRSSHHSDSPVISFGDHDLTAQNCSGQEVERLEIKREYHLEEMKLHGFVVEYNFLWVVYNRLKEEGGVFKSVSKDFNDLAKDFNDLVNKHHNQLNQKYLLFSKRNLSMKEMENTIRQHERKLDSLQSDWSHLLKEWFDTNISNRDENKSDSTKEQKLHTQIEKLLVESHDFALEVCDRLLRGYQLTGKGEDLLTEYDRLWAESDRLLEKFNHGSRSSAKERLNVAREIRDMEDKILNELER